MTNSIFLKSLNRYESSLPVRHVLLQVTSGPRLRIVGLSLRYDIKAHGGELNVDTREACPDDPVGGGKGSAFVINSLAPDL